MPKLISDMFKEIEKTCDIRIVFELPEGRPPFNVPDDMIDNTGGLYQEVRKMYIFTKNQRSANIHQIKRERVFIEMLESIHPEDAKLMLGVKEKKLPYKGITSKLVEEAFPGRFKYE